MCILSHKVKRAGAIWLPSSPSRPCSCEAMTALTKMGEFQERGRRGCLRRLLRCVAPREHMERAAHDFGGHRVEAIRAIDVAIHQLEDCLKYDRD